jgi:hypothetical protein
MEDAFSFVWLLICRYRERRVPQGNRFFAGDQPKLPYQERVLMYARPRRKALFATCLVALLLAPAMTRADVISEIDGQYGLGALSMGGSDFGISANQTTYAPSGPDGVSTFYLSLGKSVASVASSNSVIGNPLSDLTLDVSSFTTTNPTVGLSVTDDPGGKLRLGDFESPNFANFTLGGASVLSFNKDAATATIQANVTLGPGDFQFTDGSDLSPYFSGGLFTINFANVLIVPPGDGRAFFPADSSKPPIITWTLTSVPEPASVIGMLSGVLLLGGAALRRRKTPTV